MTEGNGQMGKPFRFGSLILYSSSRLRTLPSHFCLCMFISNVFACHGERLAGETVLGMALFTVHT